MAFRLLWQKLVRPLVWITASFHFIEFIINCFKSIGELKEGLRTVWPVAINIVWTLGSTVWIFGEGAFQGFTWALIAIPLAEWPVILVLIAMRLLHLQKLSLFAAAERARAFLDDGGVQVAISLIGSVGGIALVAANRGVLLHTIEAPRRLELGQLTYYIPGFAIILIMFSLGVPLYIRVKRLLEPYKKDLETRITGEGTSAQPANAHDAARAKSNPE